MFLLKSMNSILLGLKKGVLSGDTSQKNQGSDGRKIIYFSLRNRVQQMLKTLLAMGQKQFDSKKCY